MKRLTSLFTAIPKSKPNKTVVQKLAVSLFLDEIMELSDQEIANEYVHIREALDLLEDLRIAVGNHLLERAKSENIREYVVGNSNVKIYNRATKDYSNDPYWNILNAQLKEQKDLKQRHEKLLSSGNIPTYIDYYGIRYDVVAPKIEIRSELRLTSR